MEKRIEKTKPVSRIAITGPESTGKSVLSEQLAGHYHTAWVPEYAREYLDGIGRPYEFEDICQIAKGQLEREELLETEARNLLFCDTEFIVTYIWSMFKYNKCDPWIERMIEKHRYDLYLLCDIDLPWEADPLREHPEQRAELFSIYKHELESRRLPFRVVRGTGNSRLLNAIGYVEKLVAATW